MSDPRPPALARALLRLALPADLSEALDGDLEERFRARVADDPTGARRTYWKEVLSPSILRLRRESRGMHLPPGASPRPSRGDGTVRTLLADLTFALRTLLKAPAFTTIAVLSLALGIGPNTAIFSLVSAVLFEDWGVEEPEGLIDIYTLTSEGQYFFSRLSSFELIEEGATDVFEAVAHHSIFSGRMDAPTGEAELVLGEMVTGNYFDVMGVQAALGRTFLAEEDETLRTHPVVVLGHDYWQSRHGGDPGIAGSEVRLNGRPYTVVGVAPEDFNGRLPARGHPGPGDRGRRVARARRPGRARGAGAGSARAARAARHRDTARPSARPRRRPERTAPPVHRGDRGGGRRAFRDDARPRGHAGPGIRLALGAERATVIQMVLKSDLTLVGVGAAIGIGGSIVVGRTVDRLLYGSGGLDHLAFVAAPALLAAVALLATYMPARRASRVDPVQALRTE